MSEVSTILVVDDDQSIVELLRDFLECESFRVITACDTVQAWACLIRVPFIVLFLTS